MRTQVLVDACGAVGDGCADDTDAIRTAITAARLAGGDIVFGRGKTYRITSGLVFQFMNDFEVKGCGACIFNDRPSFELAVGAPAEHQDSSILVMKDCKNVTITGVTLHGRWLDRLSEDIIDLERDDADGDPHRELCHFARARGVNLDIRRCVDVRVSSCTFIDAPLDNIYVGASSVTSDVDICKRIQIMDCHFEGARRLNLALTAATDVEVLRCRFIGRAEGVRRPAAGIDVEPNHGDALGMRSLAARITVTDCVFERHAGGGIIVSEAGRTRDVSVSGCTFRDNSGWVIQSGGHRLRFENNFVASHRCFRDWSDECSSQHTCVILLTAGADSVVSGNTIRNFEESDLPAIMLRSNSSSGGSPERARVESNVVACQSGRALQIAASFVTVDANTFIVPPDNSSYLIQATQYTTAAGETYETCGLVVTNNKIIAEESAARDGGFLSIEASSHAWLVAGNHVMPSYNHTLNLGSSATLGIFSNNTLPSSSGEAGAEVLTGNRYSLLTCEIRERVAPDESDSIQSVEMVFSDCCSDLAPPPPPPPPPPPSTDLELRIVEFRVPGRQHQYSYDTLELEFELDATWSGRTRSRRFTMSRTTNTDWPIESLNVALGSGTSGGALSLRVVELDRGRGHWTEANNADDVGSARRSIARPGRFELTVLVRAAPSFPSRDLSCVVVVEANHP